MAEVTALPTAKEPLEYPKSVELELGLLVAVARVNRQLALTPADQIEGGAQASMAEVLVAMVERAQAYILDAVDVLERQAAGR